MTQSAGSTGSGAGGTSGSLAGMGPGSGGSCGSTAQVNDHGGTMVTVVCNKPSGHAGQHEAKIRLGAPGHRDTEDAWWNTGDTVAQHT